MPRFTSSSPQGHQGIFAQSSIPYSVWQWAALILANPLQQWNTMHIQQRARVNRQNAGPNLEHSKSSHRHKITVVLGLENGFRSAHVPFTLQGLLRAEGIRVSQRRLLLRPGIHIPFQVETEAFQTHLLLEPVISFRYHHVKFLQSMKQLIYMSTPQAGSLVSLHMVWIL